jgi:hypothetical protein
MKGQSDPKPVSWLMTQADRADAEVVVASCCHSAWNKVLLLVKRHDNDFLNHQIRLTLGWSGLWLNFCWSGAFPCLFLASSALGQSAAFNFHFWSTWNLVIIAQK